MHISSWYAVFFIFCTIRWKSLLLLVQPADQSGCCSGLFFITSLLIESFGSSFDANNFLAHSIRRKNKDRSVSAVLAIWARHSSFSCALFGAERNLHMVPAYSAAITAGLTFDSLMDLMMQTGAGVSARSHLLRWVSDVHQLASVTVAHLEGIRQSSSNSFSIHNSVSVMLDICAELSFEPLFDRLLLLCTSNSMDTPRMEHYKQNLLMSLGVSSECTQEVTYEQCCWARGTAPADKDIMKALQLLPKLKGLQAPPGTVIGAELQLYHQTVHLLRLFYLRKWVINKIFTWKGDIDQSGTLNSTKLEVMLGLCYLMDSLAVKTARLSLYSLTIDAEIEQTVSSRELEFEAHECASLYTHELFEKRQASEIRRVFRLHDPHDTGFIDSQTMLRAFDEGELFDKGTTLSVRTGRLPRKISFQDFERNFNEMKEHAAQQVTSALGPKDLALFQLSRVKTRVAECSKAADQDYSVMALSEVQFVFQVFLWANVVVLSLYYNNGGELDTSLDPYLICFSLAPWLEVLIGLFVTSPRTYLRYYCLLSTSAFVSCLLPSALHLPPAVCSTSTTEVDVFVLCPCRALSGGSLMPSVAQVCPHR